MQQTTSKTRLALAGAIIIVTAIGLYNSYNKRIEAQRATIITTPTTAIAGDSGSRDHELSKPAVWFLGSTLLGLVGLKRFGLYRG